jgi:flagellar hook-associated protein 3 FlgL
MRVSTLQLQQYALNSMLDQQTKLSRTQQQVASGQKFLSPADDPPGAALALAFEEQIKTLDQYQRNIERAQSALSGEESTLTAIDNQLQRVRELAVQSGNGALDADARLALSYEVRQLQDSVLALANTRDAAGEYLFSGNQTQTTPYTDAGGGTFTYNGDQGQRLINVGPSTRIAQNDPGDRIFGDINAAGGGTTDVFKVIYDFATDLENNVFNPNTIADLDSALARVVDARTSIGARQNTMEQIRDLNDSFILDTRQDLSTVKDLDYAEAISRLNVQLAGLQAAQESFVRIQNLSLFNYLR